MLAGRASNRDKELKTLTVPDQKICLVTLLFPLTLNNTSLHITEIYNIYSYCNIQLLCYSL